MRIEQTLKGATGDAERQRMTPEGRKEQQDMRLAMAIQLALDGLGDASDAG